MNLYNKLKNNMKKNKEQKEDIVNETNENIDVMTEARAENPISEENTEDNNEENLTPEQSLQREVEDWKAKHNELNDRFLRLYSEFDNYKKRTIKERLELMKNASEEMIVNLLPVIDDFDRALKSMEDVKDIEKTNEGVVLISNKIRNILSQKGLKEMDSPIGQELNTDFHEAITSIPAPNEELKGKIVDAVEKGYLLNDKVVRYAKVIIGL